MGMVKRLIWKKKLKFQGKTLEYYQSLKDWQWLSEEDLIELKNNRLKELLTHSYQNVPYYRLLLKKYGVIEDNGKIIVHLDNLPHLPLLDKDIIRTDFELLKSSDLHERKWYSNTSGGSTGEPVEFIQDEVFTDWSQAVKILDDEWSGYFLGDKKVRLWGSKRDLMIGNETLKTQIGRWLKNEIGLNAFSMSREQMTHYVKTINMFKPQQILAYVENIYDLSRFIENEKLEVFSPKSIMTSAGTLKPEMRKAIETTFRSQIFNRYGSREVGDIACECDHHNGLHVSSPTHYLEIIKPDGTLAGPGEMGEIVITSLVNYAMPLIRFRIGDMGICAEEKCSCGRHYPLLKEVTGRVSDTFVKKDGTLIRGGFFTSEFYHKNWVKRFQVIQKEYDKIEIYIVSRTEAIDNKEDHVIQEELNEIISNYKKVMGEDCRFDINFVKELLPSKSGKYRYTISEVKR